MKIEAGQFWRLKNRKSTYYVYNVMCWTSTRDGWISSSAETNTVKHVAAEMRRCGEPNPDYIEYWKEHKDVLLENYDLITDPDEIGWLALQET